MSELSDKIAYLKGLRAGMDAAADSHEGKLISALVDALDAAADEIKALRSDHEELKEYVDVLDDDLGELEDEFYNDEYDDDDDDDDMELDEDDVSFDDDDDALPAASPYRYRCARCSIARNPSSARTAARSSALRRRKTSDTAKGFPIGGWGSLFACRGVGDF